MTIQPPGRGAPGTRGSGQGEAAPGGAGVFPGSNGGGRGSAGLGDAELVAVSLVEGACLAAADGRLVWANPKFQLLDEAVKGRIAGVCRDAASAFAAVRSAGGSPEPGRAVEVVAADGSRWYEVQVSPASPPGDARGLVAALVRDITVARRLQQAVEAVDRAGRELLRYDADTLKSLNAMERLRLLEQRIVTHVRSALGFEHFAIRLVDEKHGRLQLVMSGGLTQEARELDLRVLAEGNGLAGMVACTGVSHICRDAEAEPRFLAGLTGARSSLTVPLRLHEKVLGVMDIESGEVGAFGESDRILAEVFARYIAIALNVLDVLVLERSAVNETVTGRVEGELSEPLADILREADVLGKGSVSPDLALHLDRIKNDVESIRRRMRSVAAGPQTLLGVERAMADRRHDPLLVGRRILIADDEASIRRIIQDVLHNRGADVTACANGGEAIARLDEAAAGTIGGFDLIVSDIKMPDRNGYEVFASARKTSPGSPVILMTGFGYDPHHSIVRASQEGLQSVLFKPFQVERLLDEVRKALTPKG
jgi:CheY-like chemotaxis protein